MKSSKSHYNYHDWGECINQLRSDLKISVITLCTDCNISTRTYYEIRSGLTSKSAITSAFWNICTASS